MECGEATALLDPYLDGELALERAVELERHLEGCITCTEELAARKALKAALRDKLAYHKAPQSLARALREELARGERSAPRHRTSAPPWLRLAASFLLVAALSSALTWYLMPEDAGLIPDEVFASHVRAMLSPRGVIDVASADEHTVKPWFADKLDFSPPVVDLAADDFPLTGGRVDYIGGHATAALVYLHRKHIVTLFIWPSVEAARAVVASVRQGDNLAHWSDGRMAYWAVSDLNVEELKDFARHFQAALLSQPPPLSPSRQP
ncbi:MAG: anti-sigma factor family protein [Alphaproteobacteria bacterium]